MSRPGPDHDKWNDSIAAWLLDALPDDERNGLEDHLAQCSVCRNEVEELRLAADALPRIVPQVEPGDHLRDRIMTVVEREAQLLSAAGPAADRAPRAPAARRWRLPRLQRAVALPLAASLLAVGVLAGVIGGNALRDDAAVRTTAAQLVAAAPDAAGARLEIASDSARLVGERLPPAPPGRVYQVWLKRKGAANPEPTSALFSVTEDGRASVNVPGELGDVEQVMVTDEPPGGSEAPTGELLLTAVPA